MTELLTRSGEADGPRFLWLDGGRWTDEERETLAQLMRDRFGEPNQAGYERIDRIEQALDRPEPVFCPDLALGELPQGGLLEQIHGMLHARETGRFLPLAFAIWRRRGIPQEVSAALADLLPNPDSVDKLLERLLADRVERFDEELRKLSIEALGAWCYGDPVYAYPKILEEVTGPGASSRSDRALQPLGGPALQPDLGPAWRVARYRSRDGKATAPTPPSASHPLVGRGRGPG